MPSFSHSHFHSICCLKISLYLCKDPNVFLHSHFCQGINTLGLFRSSFYYLSLLLEKRRCFCECFSGVGLGCELDFGLWIKLKYKNLFSETWEVPWEIAKLSNQFCQQQVFFFELQTSSPWQPDCQAELHMISAQVQIRATASKNTTCKHKPEKWQSLCC